MASSDADVIQRVQQAVLDALERDGLSPPHLPVVVAVSGGADSLCLLDALVAVLPDAKQSLVVGHVDHLLRPSSANDAAHVRSIAAGYGLSCKIVTADVPALAETERRGIEEAARLGRYRALRDLAADAGRQTILTGHTRDDQVETILMHLIRGSGTRGLRGIPAYEWFDEVALGEDRPPDIYLGVYVVRPLLEVIRADTQQYCEARGIRWRVDETNADPRFLRNRVRGHLLPVLRTYNDGVDRALIRLSRVMRDDDDFLDELTSQRWHRLVRQDGDRYVVDLRAWRRIRLALQRRIVRRVAARAGHDEIGFEAVERALAVGSEGGPSRAELGGGVTVERRRDTLSFTRSQSPRLQRERND
jgi:tRNA(Ile)-lysidine synthetase-like protein